MNRRSFIHLAALAPAGIPALALREERQALTIAGTTPVHMIVSGHVTEAPAERYRRQWIGRPFEGFGEFYLDSTAVRELPDALATMPGTLTFHTATVGVAAERRSYLVGAFRRDHVAVIVRAGGNNEDVMTALALHIASQDVPTGFEILWNPVHLRMFFPNRDSIGMPVEEADTYWP